MFSPGHGPNHRAKEVFQLGRSVFFQLKTPSKQSKDSGVSGPPEQAFFWVTSAGVLTASTGQRVGRETFVEAKAASSGALTWHAAKGAAAEGLDS